MLTLAALVLAFAVLATTTVLVWHGDGKADLRRCPRCWYDMSATQGLTCPECGHLAGGTAELHRSRRVSNVWLRALCLLWVLLLLGAYFSLPGPWTNKVPRPLLALALAIAAPAPTQATLGAGKGLPSPNPSFKNSKSPWERLVWDHQASVALQAWVDAVMANKGPIVSDELARLVPLADQAHSIFRQFGETTFNEGVSVAGLQLQVAQARDATVGDQNIALRYAWILSEMQFEGGDYSHRSDFAWEPDLIILQALGHSDPQVRIFGIERFGRRVHRVVVAPASPMPPGRSLIETLANSDPDATVRQRAREILNYTDGFLPRK